MESRVSGKFKYYDVESGEEREVPHGSMCVCGDCTRSRLTEALTDIIKTHKAFAPTAKKRSGKVKYGPFGTFESFTDRPEKFGYHKTTEEIRAEAGTEDEGKCFGWNVEGEQTLSYVKALDDIYQKFTEVKEVYMHLDNKPLSPDMTKGDMAVMSVDQAKAVLTLKVLYNPFFNERLKAGVEPKYRNWNRENKCWEIHPSKMKDVQAICGEFYKGVQIIGQKPVLGTKFEKLLSKLTKDDKLAMYRILALKYHPDKGGSHEAMSLVNEVFKQ